MEGLLHRPVLMFGLIKPASKKWEKVNVEINKWRNFAKTLVDCASEDVPPTMETANLEVNGLHLVDPEIIDLQLATMVVDQILPKLLQINHSTGTWEKSIIAPIKINALLIMEGLLHRPVLMFGLIKPASKKWEKVNVEINEWRNFAKTLVDCANFCIDLQIHTEKLKLIFLVLVDYYVFLYH